MFISAEIRLGIGFNAARDKLADLIRDGLLGRASGGAYDQWQAAGRPASRRGTPAPGPAADLIESQLTQNSLGEATGN